MARTVARINITLPIDLVTELKETISLRARSRLIAEAVKEKLAEMKREEAMEKLVGSWDRFGGVKFNKSRELKTWRKSLWALTEKRLTRSPRG